MRLTTIRNGQNKQYLVVVGLDCYSVADILALSRERWGLNQSLPEGKSGSEGDKIHVD